MNIILSNGQKVSVIAGANLNPLAVKSSHHVQFNELPAELFFTPKNFYLHLKGSWYNGGTDLSETSVSGLLSPVTSILDYCEKGAAVFHTHRKVSPSEIPERELAILRASLTGDPVQATADVTGTSKPKVTTETQITSDDRMRDVHQWHDGKEYYWVDEHKDVWLTYPSEEVHALYEIIKMVKVDGLWVYANDATTLKDHPEALGLIYIKEAPNNSIAVAGETLDDVLARYNAAQSDKPLTRVMKKEAINLLIAGKPVYMAKVSKTKGISEETLTCVQGDFETAISMFHTAHKANKTNTQFFS